MEAAGRGQVEAVKRLLAAGAKLDTVDRQHRTALILAINSRGEKGLTT